MAIIIIKINFWQFFWKNKTNFISFPMTISLLRMRKYIEFYYIGKLLLWKEANV